LLLLGAAAVLIESRATPATDLDPRQSTYLHGPNGAAGLADALARLGLSVQRQRRRYRTMLDRAGDGGRAPLVLVELDPRYALDRADGIELAGWPVDYGDLILAGAGADAAMACFGFRVFDRGGDSLPALAPGGVEGPGTPWVGAMLAHHLAREVVDTGGSALGLKRCSVPAVTQAETLLVTPNGRAVAVRLHPEGYMGTVTLVADGRLFSNRLLRETDAGPFALGLFAGRDSTAIFDERHQGFEPTGSLWRATLQWSRGSPWGWAAWQLAAVGLLMLLTGAIRFGPPRPLDDRRRRSPLEHVTALATALSAARGHDVAIRLLIRGLARRLAPDGRLPTDSTRLLARLQPIVRTDRGRAALAQLNTLVAPGQPADSVLAAANAVEDVWQDLRP
jgi:hypothetical protein